jgi:hypothetical protein
VTVSIVPEHVAAIPPARLFTESSKGYYTHTGAKIWPVVGKHHSKLYLQKGKIANKPILCMWASAMPDQLAQRATWFVERNTTGKTQYSVMWFDKPIEIGQQQKAYGFIVDLLTIIPVSSVPVSEDALTSAWKG